MKNKNLRKALAVSMAIAMTGGLLAGCGSSSSGSSSSGTTNSGSTSSASGELDTSEFVELSMYVISDRPAGQDAVDENLNKLLKEKLNCSLKINWIGWAEYANKYPLLFSSGEEFDMAYSASWLNMLISTELMGPCNLRRLMLDIFTLEASSTSGKVPAWVSLTANESPCTKTPLLS